MAAQDFSAGSQLHSIGAIAKDAGAGAAGAAAFTVSFLNVIDSLEKLVIGALTILILALRVYAHLKGKG